MEPLGRFQIAKGIRGSGDSQTPGYSGKGGLYGKHARQEVLVATVFGLRLCDYPLGSQRSRAAARALQDARRASAGGKEGTLVQLIATGKPHEPDRECICPSPGPGTFSLCRFFL